MSFVLRPSSFVLLTLATFRIIPKPTLNLDPVLGLGIMEPIQLVHNLRRQIAHWSCPSTQQSLHQRQAIAGRGHHLVVPPAIQTRSSRPVPSRPMTQDVPSLSRMARFMTTGRRSTTVSKDEERRWRVECGGRQTFEVTVPCPTDQASGHMDMDGSAIISLLPILVSFCEYLIPPTPPHHTVAIVPPVPSDAMNLRNVALGRTAAVGIVSIVVILSLFSWPGRTPLPLGESLSPSPESNGRILSHGESTADHVPAGSKPLSIFRAGQPLHHAILTSPSNAYTFGLQPGGQLSLVNTTTNTEVFSTDTAFHWPVEYHLELTPHGVLELSWTNPDFQPFQGKLWASSMLPNCDAVPQSPLQPYLQLHDSGLLEIKAGDKVVCTLHRATGDKGRLAIVYAGFLRTYLQTCPGHYEKLVAPWTGSGGVDVHIYAYLDEVYHEDEEDPSAESIEQNLRSCFGDHLKTLTLVHIQDFTESWTDAPVLITATCGQARVDRHLNQFKTIYLAAQQVQRYKIENGIRYDYILKARLDMLLHGDVPRLESLEVDNGELISPRVAMDRNWYTLQHHGNLRAGISDMFAFSKESTMWIYMGFYLGFKRQVELDLLGQAPYKSFNTHALEKAASDEEKCTVEGNLGYWLGSHDITVKTDWRWEMGLLRKSGEVVFTCPDRRRKWLCPGS
ncbi:hypothetical protein B7494_g5188 [Chlorociboria aeruginascens]|nr:hypothetical protein B7494_g5188 [Chlorociboria aeruginascens]